MSSAILGRLERVDLRSVWANEAGAFTPWLAQEENLRLLGETVGLELELESQEKAVGPFRADILCKDTAQSDHWVLVENQLERTDHTHLGQLLTYAAGLKAATIIWIAEQFRDEHRAALDWLNEITDERFAFFGLELELWRISGSPAAPKFNVVSKPNEWTRTVQGGVRVSADEITDHKQRQLQFWTAFKQYIEENSNMVRCQKPLPQHWMNHAIGRSGFKLCSVVSSWNSESNVKEPEIRAELIIEDRRHAKAHFALLHEEQSEIEAAFGQPLTWHNPPNARMCRVFVRRTSDFLNPANWSEQHEWLRLNLERLHQVFASRIRQLDVPTSLSEVTTMQDQMNRRDGAEAV